MYPGTIRFSPHEGQVQSWEGALLKFPHLSKQSKGQERSLFLQIS